MPVTIPPTQVGVLQGVETPLWNKRRFVPEGGVGCGTMQKTHVYITNVNVPEGDVVFLAERRTPLRNKRRPVPEGGPHSRDVCQ